MDYLFGIVVLLCGVVQAGRGAKPKHNVPRLKLSYKGKTPPEHPPPRLWDMQSCGGAFKAACPACFCLRLLFYALLFMHSFLFGVFFSLSSISVNLFLPVSLIHSSILVSKQHLTLCLTSFLPFRCALPSVSQNSLFF